MWVFCNIVICVLSSFAIISLRYNIRINHRCEDGIGYSYTMGCPPVRGDNPRALASGLSHIQVDKHGITTLYHLHQ